MDIKKTNILIAIATHVSACWGGSGSTKIAGTDPERLPAQVVMKQLAQRGNRGSRKGLMGQILTEMVVYILIIMIHQPGGPFSCPQVMIPVLILTFLIT